MMTTMKRHAAALLLLASIGMPASQAAPAPDAAKAEQSLPGNSLYQLHTKLVDQNGDTFDLASRRGKPMIVSMFYTSCQFVCPMLVETIQLTTQKLTADERARLGAMLVTFDPARDDAKALKETAGKHQLDAEHWTLARTDASSVRKFAAALGIQYRQLPDGEFNHSTVLVLLDSQGRIVGRSNKMGNADPAFLKLVKATLHSSE